MNNIVGGRGGEKNNLFLGNTFFFVANFEFNNLFSSKRSQYWNFTAVMLIVLVANSFIDFGIVTRSMLHAALVLHY